ncbi:YdbH family protein [Atlantibacter hermannii]|uniref:YdbH family protein n=1 Tax=Atlantibacter hermannii TaxID=565 RepID=UPI00289FECDD|nr:YdbH family protein [Atlantibacter hermannii]
MKGKYRALIALALLLILLPLALLLTVAHWLPGLVGIWLPPGTRIALEERPRLTRHAVVLPHLSYLAGECELAKLTNATLSHPSRWKLDIDTLVVNSACFDQLPAGEENPAAPRTLAEWQAMLPNTWLTINQLTLAPWQQFAGELTASLTPARQTFRYHGDAISLAAQIDGQTATITEFTLNAIEGQQPLSLAGEVTLGLLPDGLPTQGHLITRLHMPGPLPLADAELEWSENRGQLLISAPDDPDPLLDLPWTVSRDRLSISDGRWHWTVEDMPLSGRLGINVDNWREGPEAAQISGRMNVVTQGAAGKGNAVLNFGPGKLSLTDSAMPVQLTGEAKQDQMIFYAVLPGMLRGPLLDPQLRFAPGALLRSRGRVIDALNIDEIRWPLAGVKVASTGVDGRLQAILRAHENQMGDFELHLDGQANDFLPDSGLWQWHYWGKGGFTPMQARWDVKGTGEWRDNTIVLNTLSTGFDKLQYGSMRIDAPRLAMDKPVRWVRDPDHPSLTGALTLDAGETLFTGGSVLPPSRLNFSVEGSDPTSFQFTGDLHADAIGPVQVNGRWDGVRVRGQAWWPAQPLAVFQPLIPPDWKMALREGRFYAQVAFSAAAEQGFEAGGHGVVKGGSAWMPDNRLDGVDFVLPFRFSDSTWQLGTRGPVTLRIASVKNQVEAQNLTADLQGWYPWSEQQPLILSNVNVDVLGGNISMQQLRMPQHDAALLRVNNISSSQLITAINPKQFTLSGRVNGALPLWLNDPDWIIRDGWLTNPGPMTLRLDKDMADALARDNMAAGAAINWLRYMEIARSWTRLNLTNLGVLTLRAELQGTSRLDGKSNTVRLNYQHQENLFTLWRSLRFGDNLQAWLEQHASLPDGGCAAGDNCEEPQ